MGILKERGGSEIKNARLQADDFVFFLVLRFHTFFYIFQKYNINTSR